MLRWIPLLLAASLTTGATCNSSSDVDGGAPSASASGPLIELAGVETSSLTKREHQVWSGYVRELIAPCPDVAVPIAQCVQEKRGCDLCVPAARFLLRQVQTGRPKKQVAELYAARFDPKMVKDVQISGSAMKGARDGVVTVVEFADFECPACGMVAELLEQVYLKYGKQMRLVFKHFPLQNHPNATLAAQAAYAAQRQGMFWKMHRRLFNDQQRLTEPDLINHAKELGLDVKRFKREMHSDEAKKWIAKEKAQGEQLGVKATPTIFVNGRDCDLSKLANPLKDFEDWIELEIKIASKKRPTATGSSKPAPTAKPSATAAAPSASAGGN